MATASLTNMTVPLGADGQSSSTQGLLMPKLAYRFRVFFSNFGVSTPTTELTKQVMKFDRPHVQFDEIKLPIYNSTIKLAGKYTWIWKKMTMVITPFFLGLRGQSPSSLEDDGRGHGHLHNSSLRKGGRWPWSSFPYP